MNFSKKNKKKTVTSVYAHSVVYVYEGKTDVEKERIEGGWEVGRG